MPGACTRLLHSAWPTGSGAARAQMVKRGGLEEMCSLLMLVAQEEEQRLASEPGYQGVAADGDEPAELDGAQRLGWFPLVF